MSSSIQILIDKFKNDVFDKVELEYQDKETLNKLLPFLVYHEIKEIWKSGSRTRNFNAESGLLVFHTNFNPRVDTFRLRFLVEQIKRVVMKIYEFEWRDY